MNKIQALKTTIEKIESGEYKYNWFSSDNCNCGLVAKTLLNGKDPSECGSLESPVMDTENRGCFARAAYCMTTNLPLPVVFQKLKDAGFTHTELLELEQLGNEQICKNLGLERLYQSQFDYYFHYRQSDKDCLILYLREWVKILEAEQPKQVIRYVFVPQTINEQAKKLILS